MVSIQDGFICNTTVIVWQRVHEEVRTGVCLQIPSFSPRAHRAHLKGVQKINYDY